MTMAWTCEPGWETALISELARASGPGQHFSPGPGWVTSENLNASHGPPMSVALAAQCLPKALECFAPSISTWARMVGEALIERLREHNAGWRLHVFSHYAPGDVSGPRRCQLIVEALREFLERKQRRLLRSRRQDITAPWLDGEALVQLGLMDASRGVLSMSSPEDHQALRQVVSRFPGGKLDVADQAAAPSRAFRKLAEVELRLNRQIATDEHCVDLGSSPGSWAWLALGRGASVTAIDRSPLRDDLMRHPRLQFVKGDAFRFMPEASVDWLLSDVIAFPERILDLLHTWLSNNWCRQFCVTIKFRGQEEYARLEDCKTLLRSLDAEFCLRRLTHNKNEVTAYGYAAGVASKDAVLC